MCSRLRGRSTNPDGGFAEEDFRGPEIPGTLKKSMDRLFVKPAGLVRKPPSNVHLEEINKKDGSLLRENRIHGAFHMTRKMLNDSIKSKSE